MPEQALSPGETFGDYVGSQAPETLRQCSYVMDWGGVVCSDDIGAGAHLPDTLIDTHQTVIGGAINDATNALRSAAKDLGTTFRNDLVAPAKSVGAWVVVVLGLAAFIAFEVRR